MKDELTMKTEYKKVFTKLYTPETLRRKVQALPKGEMKQKKAPLMKKLAIAAAVILVLFLGSNGIVYASTGKTWMGYLIKPGTEEWVKLGTVQNKREACRIPEETLKQMSNDELIEAVLEYPFLVDIYLFGMEGEPVRTAAKSVYEGCDALRELLSRRDGEEALRAFRDEALREFYENDGKDSKEYAISEWEIDAIGTLLEVLCE